LKSKTEQPGLIPRLTWLRRYRGQWLRSGVAAAAATLLLLAPLLLVRLTEFWRGGEMSGPGHV
jgi:hypothetical protein